MDFLVPAGGEIRTSEQRARLSFPPAEVIIMFFSLSGLEANAEDSYQQPQAQPFHFNRPTASKACWRLERIQ
jgi:hypothetical protein